MIERIIDDEGTEHRSIHEIMRTFRQHMQKRYTASTIDEESWNSIAEAIDTTLTKEQQNALQEPITRAEVRKAIFDGAKKKSPGSDGLCLELYQETWNELAEFWVGLFQDMFRLGKRTTQQKHGTIVCVPKQPKPRHVVDYRPITLLNADYKIMARIITTRLRKHTTEILHQSQFCGRTDATIYDALATIRDVIAFSEERRQPLCALSIDFSEAFDRIEHN